MILLLEFGRSELKEISEYIAEGLPSTNVFADDKIRQNPPTYSKQMDRKSQRKSKDENTVSRQALLQSPRQFKNILDPQFTFSSVPPALPPKTSSKMKLKPITVNFDGGSRVALSHDSQTTSSSKSCLQNDSRLSCTAPGETIAAPNDMDHFASKLPDTLSQPSDTPYLPLTAASKLTPKPTFARDYFKSNGNNNNSGISNLSDGSEDRDIQVCLIV